MPLGEILIQAGELPIPPYLQRDTEEGDCVHLLNHDAEYEGSVTHLRVFTTRKVFKSLMEKGVRQEKLTLHVGGGYLYP